MTKKSGFMLFVLLVLTIGVVWFGQDYQKKQKLELIEINGSSQTNKKDASENKEKSDTTKIDSFEKNRDQKSVLDYLSSVPTDDEKKVISFYGDFSESDEWFLTVGKYISEQVDGNVEINSIALPDFDSYRLLEENTVSSLAEKTPDVVFFQLPVYGDQVRDISLADSKSYTMQDYEEIKQELPETLVVFVTPNPSNSRKEKYNSRTLVYTSYLESVIEIINENNLPLFDLHEAYNAELQSSDSALENTLIEDGKTLNDEGNKLYSTVFNKQLTEPVDTTSGR